MIRYNYLPLEQTLNGINFYDLTRLDWNQFQFKRGVRTYKLSSSDIDRFYDLVNTEYDSLVIEDWIYAVNRIDDPTVLEVGQEIVLPNILDIQDFLTDQLGVRS